MKCDDVRISAMEYIEGRLGLAEEMDFRNHTSSCFACRHYLKKLSGEQAMLRRALAPSAGSARRTRTILAAVRGEDTGRRLSLFPLAKTVRFAASFPGVAVVLLCVLVALLRQSSSAAVASEPGNAVLPIREAVELRMALTSHVPWELDAQSSSKSHEGDPLELPPQAVLAPVTAVPDRSPDAGSTKGEESDDRQAERFRHLGRVTWQMA